MLKMKKILTSSVIRFFVTKKWLEIEKLDENWKNSYYWHRISSYLMNDLRNFNEIFRKDVTYDNIKKQAFTVSLEDTVWEKPYGGVNFTPLSSLFRVKQKLNITGIYHYCIPIYYHKNSIFCYISRKCYWKVL